MATCRTCGAPIVWVTMDSGKRMPVDADASPDGTVVVERGRGRVDAAHPGPRFTSHFVTCPDAAEHRR